MTSIRTMWHHISMACSGSPPQCKNLYNTRPQELVLVRVCVLVLPTIGCCILPLLMSWIVLTLQLTLHGGGYFCHELAIYVPHLFILGILCSSGVWLYQIVHLLMCSHIKPGSIVVCDVMCVSLCVYVCVCAFVHEWVCTWVRVFLCICNFTTNPYSYVCI